MNKYIRIVSDLSNQFNPAPKPTQKPKKEPKAIAKGKKTKDWEEERQELKKKFQAAGITKCELNWNGCWKNNALGFAHPDKRINISREELGVVILACNPCHQVLERMPREKMRATVEDVINNRLVDVDN